MSHFSFRGVLMTPRAFAFWGGVLLAGCDGIPDPKGRYQGEFWDGGTRVAVVARATGVLKEGSNKTVQFKVYPVLGSALARRYKLTFLPDDSIRLLAPELRGETLTLARHQSCASGDTAGRTLRVCWNEGEFELEVRSVSGELQTRLTMKRGEEPFPVIERATGQPYSLDELAGRARFQNYDVEQDLYRVYQSRDRLTGARMKLLPHLSLRTAGGILLGETGSMIEAVGTLLPFLFPSNWFRLEQAGALSEAQLASFAALRGNQIQGVEDLFYVVQSTQRVSGALARGFAWLARIQNQMRKEEKFGTAPAGTADRLETALAALQQERITVENYLRGQLAELSHATALGPIGGISGLSPVKVPDLSSVKAVRAADFSREALARSYELKTLRAWVRAARAATRAETWNFLDLNEGKPIGPGMGIPVRIARSEANALEKRADEMGSLVELKCLEAENQFNSALASHQAARRGLDAVERDLNRLMHRLMTGDPTLDGAAFAEELEQVQAERLTFEGQRIVSEGHWLSARSKIQRLMLEGFYSGLDAGLAGDAEHWDRNAVP